MFLFFLLDILLLQDEILNPLYTIYYYVIDFALHLYYMLRLVLKLCVGLFVCHHTDFASCFVLNYVPDILPDLV